MGLVPSAEDLVHGPAVPPSPAPRGHTLRVQGPGDAIKAHSLRPQFPHALDSPPLGLCLAERLAALTAARLGPLSLAWRSDLNCPSVSDR